MKYLTCLLLIIVSCKQKDKENPIVGKWEYERMEMFSGESMNLQDSMINNLHQQQKGLTFTFTNINVFKVTQRKPDNTEVVVSEQPYELAEDNKSVSLKNKTKEDDRFDIIEISDRLLKINVFYSKEAYMVFGKKN
jgi:hypothetical protein